jgi:hypothetical protein
VDERLARFIAVGRIAVGTSLVLHPPLALRFWIGGNADLPGAKVLGRALGARDLVLGAGTLAALAGNQSPDWWLRASLVADATDLTVTLVARDDLPPVGRDLVAAVAAAATAVGAKLVLTPKG